MCPPFAPLYVARTVEQISSGAVAVLGGVGRGRQVFPCFGGVGFVVSPASVSNVSTTERGDSSPAGGSAWCSV